MVASLAVVLRRLRLAFAVCTLGAASCADSPETGNAGDAAREFSTAPDAAIGARLRAIRERFGAVVQPGTALDLVVPGSRVIPRARTSVRGAAALGIELPLRADGPLRVTDPRSQLSVDVSLRGTAPVPAETEDGLLFFAGALDGADVIHRPTAEQAEDFVVFEREPPATELRYELALNERTAHIRLLGRTLELLDSDGVPRLAMVPPYAVDRLGERRDVQVALDGCTYDADPRDPRGRALPAPGSRRCELRLTWARGLEHPLLIDPAWVTTQSPGFSARTLTKLSDGRVLATGNFRQAALYSASTGTWATTGTMLVARDARPAAVLLSDGRVGVFGGSAACSSNTVEFYSASTGTWAAGTNMLGGRTAHSATTVGSKVLIVPGDMSCASDGGSRCSELYDPAGASTQFACRPVDGSDVPGTPGHRATLLPSGRVLVTGGSSYNGLNNIYKTVAFIIDPAGPSFAATTAMPSQRGNHSAAVLANGKVLISGGNGNTGSSGTEITLATSALYDIASATWTAGPNVGQRAYHATVRLPSGDYVLSGAPSQLYDPVANTAVSAGTMTLGSIPTMGVLLDNGSALFVTPTTSNSNAVLFSQQGNGLACDAPGQCTSKFCVTGVCCSTACTGNCQACSAAAKQSGADGVCGNAKSNTDPQDDCADQGATTCGNNGMCNGSGACAFYPVGTACGASTCSAGTQSGLSCNGAGSCNVSTPLPCTPYVCANGNSCATSCSAHAGCVSTHYCRTSDGTCQPDKTNGNSCSSGEECGSGNCVDGFCCDAPCAGACQACSAAKKGSGADGVCGNIASGADPDGECPDDGAASCDRNGMCNGAGACRLYPLGTACGSTTCTSGQQSGQQCDGFGTCSSTSGVACSPYKCLNTIQCATSCSGDAICVDVAWCDESASTCKADKANGAACSNANECVSGFCVDGVCCDQGCTGTCRACTAAKKGSGNDGVCGTVRIATDPDGECPDDGASSCDRNGFCDGSGACQLYTSGTACGSTTCSSGTQTGFGCDGFGTCAANGTAQCTPYVCQGSACGTTCSNDTGCVATHHCAAAACAPDKLGGSACTRASECQSGNCVDGFCCDSPCTGVCQACSNARTGRPNGECRPVTGGTDPDDDCAAEAPSSCGTNGLCSGAASCAVYPSGTACGSTTCSNNQQTGFACDGAGACQSSSTTQCAPYFCQGSTCGTTCATDASCAASHHCSGASKCDADQANGAACTRDSMCVSGFCVDGVCCDQACDSPCRACSAAKKGGGANGVCAAVASGSDPDNDCPADAVTTCDRTGSCDGTGKCELYPRQTQCGAAVCSGTTLTGRQCDGLGGCQDGQTSSCGAYRCNASGSSCLDACASAADCVPSAYCSGLTCVPKKAAGEACSGASECSSGFCVDGVCCDSKCDGLCQACAASAKASGVENGKCDFAKAGLDPHDNCTDDGAPSCDQDGTCDGSGGCARYPGGSPCGATSCVNNAVTGYTCDGAGTCHGGTSVSCGDYLCAQGACRDACTVPTAVDDCAPGAFCQDSQCRPKKAGGDPCSAAAECTSGFCADGVCCNGLCSGQCEACDVVGARGTCTPVVGAPHGSREPCSVDDPNNPCSARICDGDTRTTCGGFIGTEQSCREPSCSSGVAVLPASCNGKGVCPEAQRAECGKYACAGTVCGKAPCSSNAECSPGFRCDEGIRDCVPLDSAVCEKDGHTLRSPDGTTKDCKPYVCEADHCKESCTSTTDCLAGHVCDSARKNCIATGKGGAAEDDSGCGCRLPGHSRSMRTPLVLALAVLGVCVRRRRRNNGAT